MNKYDINNRSDISDFCFLKGLKVWRDISDLKANPYNIEIELQSDLGGKISLLCHNIAGLKVGNIENMLRLNINIYDIKSDQIEGIRYNIKEIEHGTFSFMCYEIYIIE